MFTIKNILEWLKLHAPIVLGIFVALDILHRIISLAAGPFPLFQDAIGYWQIGKSITAGTGFSGDFPEGFRTPIYPLYLASFQVVFGPYGLQAAVIGQHVLGIATSLVVYALCVRLTGDSRFGLLAYFICALGFGRIQYDNSILSEALFIFLLAVHISLFTSILKKPSVPISVAAGFVLGLSILTRPIAVLLWLVEVPLLIMVPGKSINRADIRNRNAAIALLVSMLITVIPWPIRNSIRFGDFVLRRDLGITSWENTFKTKAAGLSLPSGDLTGEIKNSEWRSGFGVAQALRNAGYRDSEIHRFMKKTVWTARREEKWTYLRLLAANMLLFWIDNEEAIPFYLRAHPNRRSEFADQMIWVSPEFVAPFESILRFLYRFPVWFEAAFSVLAWIGCFFLIRLGGWHRSVGILIAGVMLYFCFTSIGALYPLYRFRVVLQPLMVVSCVTGLWAFWHKWKCLDLKKSIREHPWY